MVIPQKNRTRSAAMKAIDALEQRQLLASISGTVIEDLDYDFNRDGRELGQAGVTVFLDQNMNRSFEAGESFTTTDANGFYEFTNLPEGTHYVALLPPADFGQMFPNKNGFGELSGNFDLEIRFQDDNLSSKARSLIESAAARWEKVLIGDLLDMNDPELGNIDDIVIDASGEKVDGKSGVLAFARPLNLRPSDGPNPNLPFRGEMTFDLDDVNDPTFFETAVHEMGHALGFTDGIWDLFGLLTNSANNPEFLGENAGREYQKIFRAREPRIPVQNASGGAGSAFAHWSEDVFEAELMSPFSEAAFGEPMSSITIGSMQDIGYDVNYRGGDFYDPINQGFPFTTPDFAGGGPLDFSYEIAIGDADQSVQGRDFITRINRRPSLDALRTSNTFFETGDIVRLQAVGPFDVDPGDEVVAVKFYAETNGLPGLQTGAGGDAVVGSDDFAGGGFRINANTEALGLGAGEATFYARPFDELFVGGKPKTITVGLFDADSPPRKPSVVTSTPRSSSEMLVSWTDRSNNEAGFRIERSTHPSFDREVRRTSVAANVTSIIDADLNSSTEYFYRVRAFNTGGASSFAGPSSAITLSPGEVIVDDFDTVATSYDGRVQFFRDGAGRGGSFAALNGEGAIARFAPQLSQTGEYYVYAAWRNDVFDSSAANARFSVTEIDGDVRTIAIDQTSRGRSNGEVLLGQFSFKRGNRTVVQLRTSVDNVVTIDQLRFVPIG